MSALQIKLLPIFNDNYVFVIVHTLAKSCVVVDPGDAQPVLNYLRKQNLLLEAVLLTHHHDDHIGGAQELKEQYQVPVYAPLKNKTQILFATDYVVEGQALSLLSGELQLNVLELPGHTLGHVAYHESRAQWLFSGDVLFGLGCGRLFEGTFAQGFESLQRIKKIPDDTLVYCTHEYTESNLRFSESIASADSLTEYKKQLTTKRSANLPSVPLDLGAEKKINLFLAAEDLEHFTYLRELKNRS